MQPMLSLIFEKLQTLNNILTLHPQRIVSLHRDPNVHHCVNENKTERITEQCSQTDDTAHEV